MAANRCVRGFLSPRIVRDASAATYKRGDMLACADGTDLLKPAETATDLRVMGALLTIDADEVVVANNRDRQFSLESAPNGIGPFKNSAGPDEITTDNVDEICWVVDSETVALTNGGGTRSPAGYIRDVDDQGGIYVDFTKYEHLATMRLAGVIGGP